MNFEEFRDATGCEPEQDDLERANCTKAGLPGHYSCGICPHQIPTFMCLECFRVGQRLDHKE
jgi:hypothetical protein